MSVKSAIYDYLSLLRTNASLMQNAGGYAVIKRSNYFNNFRLACTNQQLVFVLNSKYSKLVVVTVA